MAEPRSTQPAGVNGRLGRSGLANDREISKLAATQRGVHDRLAALDPERPHSYRARRTLRFRVEFVRQVKRRRTQIAFGLLLVLPVILAIAFKFGGAADDTGGAPQLVGLATWYDRCEMIF